MLGVDAAAHTASVYWHVIIMVQMSLLPVKLNDSESCPAANSDVQHLLSIDVLNILPQNNNCYALLLQ